MKKKYVTGGFHNKHQHYNVKRSFIEILVIVHNLRGTENIKIGRSGHEDLRRY